MNQRATHTFAEACENMYHCLTTLLESRSKMLHGSFAQPAEVSLVAVRIVVHLTQVVVRGRLQVGQTLEYYYVTPQPATRKHIFKKHSKTIVNPILQTIKNYLHTIFKLVGTIGSSLWA